MGSRSSTKGKTAGDGLPQLPKIIEQTTVSDAIPCSHSHTDTDDIDLFGQTENVRSFFGVRVSAQLLEWSEKKFLGRHIYIYNYDEGELTKLRDVLVERFGQPHFASAKSRIDQWVWRDKKIQI